MKITGLIDWAIILWASVIRGLLVRASGLKPMVPTNIVDGLGPLHIAGQTDIGPSESVLAPIESWVKNHGTHNTIN